MLFFIIIIVVLSSCGVAKESDMALSRTIEASRLESSKMAGLSGYWSSNGNRQRIDFTEWTVELSAPDSLGRQWPTRERVRAGTVEAEDSTEAAKVEVVEAKKEAEEETEAEEEQEEHTAIKAGNGYKFILFVIVLFFIMCKRAQRFD